MPGSIVFTQARSPVDLSDPSQWWRYVAGANWRDPQEDRTSWRNAPHHPVVHVSLADATAYAAWAGKALRTEPEWEFAARGGLDGVAFAGGKPLEPQGRPRANYWQGEFPHQNLLTDAYARSSPVRSFPANGYCLFDMTGNVWEWTTTPFAIAKRRAAADR